MPFAFAGRTVLVISPQPWGDVHVSKHHYAIELAKGGAHVFFLGPPSSGGLRFTPVENGAVVCIDHSMFDPRWLRFKARALFDVLMRRHVRTLVAHIRERTGKSLDAVWCFELNLYTDLRWFDAPIRIYHPVDPVTRRFQKRPAESATLLLSVSNRILQTFAQTAPGVPRQVINHGIHDAFALIARAGLESDDWQATASPKVGYVGNLTHPAVHRDLLLTLIDAFPSAKFVFWGPFEDSNIGSAGDAQVAGFLRALRDRPNVELAGVRPAPVLAGEINRVADVFLLAYSSGGSYDRSNSHKMLEYLATGKPVVSVRISEYEDKRDLLWMAQDDDDGALVGLLRSVLEILTGGAPQEALAEERAARKRRREFALQNTYAGQIRRIEGLIST